jgi:hypothetical protein
VQSVAFTALIFTKPPLAPLLQTSLESPFLQYRLHFSFNLRDILESLSLTWDYRLWKHQDVTGGWVERVECCSLPCCFRLKTAGQTGPCDLAQCHGANVSHDCAHCPGVFPSQPPSNTFGPPTPPYRRVDLHFRPKERTSRE